MSRPPEPRRLRSARGGIGAVSRVALLLALAALTGCTFSGKPPQTPSASASAAPSPTATATPTRTPNIPAIDPDASAEENLPFFGGIVASVWGSPQNASGRAYIDALVTAGFDKGAMELTPDQSTVGNPAESIQFSVIWKGECLVGQVGPATGTPVAVVVPVLGDGSCLVGVTRPIDW